jgi:hypothetical protein
MVEKFTEDILPLRDTKGIAMLLAFNSGLGCSALIEI